MRCVTLCLDGRFYNLADLSNGILKKGREIFLTGCYLRPGSGGSGNPRLLPTEHLVTLLDEVFSKLSSINISSIISRWLLHIFEIS